LLEGRNLLSASHLAVHPGRLRPASDTGGVVSVTFTTPTFAPVGDVAVQPDGKVIVASTATVGGHESFAVARYNTNGSLDNSFGTAGRATLNIDGGDDEAAAVALQPDGKIVVAGNGGGKILLARFNSDGTPDPTFGTGGGVITPRASPNEDPNEEANDVKIGPDGSIYVAGSDFNGSGQGPSGPSETAGRVLVVRYNADGTLDPTFGNGGKTLTGIPGALSSGATALTIQSDGEVVVLGDGTLTDGGDDTVAVFRFYVNGAPDFSFGNNGIVAMGMIAEPGSVAVQSDGKIVFGVGDSLLRLEPNGAPDSSFGRNGTVAVGFAPNATGGIALNADGEIAVSGMTSVGPAQTSALASALYQPDGRLDRRYGSGGVLTTPFTSAASAGIGIESNGNFVTPVTGAGQYSLIGRYVGIPGSSLPASAIGASVGTISLGLSNETAAAIRGRAKVTLFASASTTLDSSAVALGLPVTKQVALTPGRSVPLRLKYVFPASLTQGSYYVLAEINQGGGSSVTASNAQVSVITPVVDLAAAFPQHLPTPSAPGGKGLVLVTVVNDGNSPAHGTASIALSALPSGGTATAVASELTPVNLVPGKTGTFRIRYRLPLTLAAGPYQFSATVQAVSGFADADSADNTAIDPTPFTLI